MTPLKQNSRVSGFGGGTTADIERAAAHRDFDHVVEFPQDIERANRAAEQLPPDVVYAGFSLGVLPAQKPKRVSVSNSRSAGGSSASCAVSEVAAERP